MQLGQVTQYIVATKKNEGLVGKKLLNVRIIRNQKLTNDYVVAIDSVGAGEGEVVLLAMGSAARIGMGCENAPVDASIVGIVDDPASVLSQK